MINKNKCLAVIPARGGSKRLKRKNIKSFNGKPLIAWSIIEAKKSKFIDSIIVSTEDQEIADIAIKYGALVPYLRPDHLAMDHIGATEPILEILENYLDIKQIVLLQPTSPLRRPDTIDAAITHFISSNCNSLVSVCEDHSFTWKNIDDPLPSYDVFNRPRRQDIPNHDRIYRETGSIYITDWSTLKRTGSRLGGHITMFEMNSIEQLEIDTEIDLMLVTHLMEHFFHDFI